MDDLRLALLIAGIALVAVIYGFTRLSRDGTAIRTDDDASDHPTRDPPDEETDRVRDQRIALEARLSSDDDTDSGVDDLAGLFTPLRETSNEALSVDVSALSDVQALYERTIDHTVAPVDAKSIEQPSLDTSRSIVVLTLISRQGQLLGPAIHAALDAEGLQPGPMHIYHYRKPAEPDHPIIFSVANLLEPGELESNTLPDLETPGLVMFMEITEDPAGARQTLDTMIAIGRSLADRLQATLCDETHNTLTKQTVNYLHEQIMTIAHRRQFEN